MRVNVLCEDRTGTGLARVIERAVNSARLATGRPELEFPRKPGTVLNNARLLEYCGRYQLYRFRSRERWDHVVYVIDAHRLWGLPEVGRSAPTPNDRNDRFGAYLQDLSRAAVDAMTRHARGPHDDDQWREIADGFHPHVLVWERESLMLPVADELGLGTPPDDPVLVRHPARWVEDRMRAHSNDKYVKATDGRQFLGRIAYDDHLRARVLAATPSLRAIVEPLAAL